MCGDQVRFDAPLPDLWDDEQAAALDDPGLLLYRSNLLGGDLRITNFGGGNTSAKLEATDPLTGAPTQVFWVKGSGGDIGSMKLDGFSTLYMDKLLSLKSIYRGPEHEDEMVELYNHCTFNLNPRATSIDTTLHGFVPHAHVDHVHADAVIAIAASEDAGALTNEIYRGELGFLSWQRPGFDLGLKLGAMAEANPNMKGVVLGGHGLFTWAPTSKECYRITIEMINKAGRWLAKRRGGQPSEGRVWRPCHGQIGAMLRLDYCLPFAGTFLQVNGRLGISPMRRRCWSSSIRAISSPWPRLGPPARITSCARKSARSCCLTIRQRAISTR